MAFRLPLPHKASSFLVEIITLQTPRGRVSFFIIASLAVYFSRYDWLAHLSLWPRLGWDTAPSIGLTRAYWLLLHGDPVSAWHRNWLIVPVLLVWSCIFVPDIMKLIKKP